MGMAVLAAFGGWAQRKAWRVLGAERAAAALGTVAAPTQEGGQGQATQDEEWRNGTKRRHALAFGMPPTRGLTGQVRARAGEGGR